jgi:hypothetical protein
VDVSDKQIDTACSWSDDEINEAIKTAQAIEIYDPETAKLLYAQANEAKQKRYGNGAPTGNVYDPMALYARILKFYEGAISEERLDYMDYRRFFGYVREAELIAEEQQEQVRTQKQNNASMVVNALPQAQEYTGETMNLVG